MNPELIIDAIDKHHEEQAEEPRQHLGASILGHYCDRYIWLTFRMPFKPGPIGRIKRIFRRGKLEEAKIKEDLRAVGFKVNDYDLGSFYLAWGHIGGTPDCIVRWKNEEEMIAEFKTHNLASFKRLLLDGVKNSHPQHYRQLQLYLYGLCYQKGLYYAVCKDNDSLHLEVIDRDNEVIEMLKERGQRLVNQIVVPPKVSQDPSWFKCKTCTFYKLCHFNDLDRMKAKSYGGCRLCEHSGIGIKSKWICDQSAYNRTEKDIVGQQEACSAFDLNTSIAEEMGFEF